ncbi:MAG: beta-lactamase family protein [Chloroflexi bacterium]|nr:beta-lactamase family protein [Chloroflexota bacterium]
MSMNPGTSDLETIKRIVAEERARYPIPGLSIGVLDGDAELTAAFGDTSVDHPLPVTVDTYFQVGSITKTFLGTLVMGLVDAGRLDLGSPVRRWVPDLELRNENAAANVTLTHCLTHTCGWSGDCFDDFGRGDDALEKYVAAMRELEQQVPLGAEWAYNNAAFALAGRVVEVVTGEPIETAVRTHVLELLGLEKTFFFADEVVTYRASVGHNVFEKEARVARPWAIPRSTNAVGGIVSNVPQLLAYARFHMGDGRSAAHEVFMSRGSLDLMRMPLVPAADGLFRGIAWSVEDKNGIRIIGHGGSVIGQQALLWVAPAKRAALVVLTNTNRAAQLQNALTRWWRQRYLGIAYAPPQIQAHTPEQATRVAGRYVNPNGEIDIKIDDTRLVFHHNTHGSLREIMEEPPPQPEPVQVGFTRPGRLVHLEGPLKDTAVELLAADDAPIEWIRYQGRLFKKQ